MLISDEFNGQPPLSGHLPSPQWWPLDGSSELIQLFTPFKNSVKKILLIARYFPEYRNNNAIISIIRGSVYSFSLEDGAFPSCEMVLSSLFQKAKLISF